MCLYVKQEFKTRKEAREYRNQPQIADKNIRVYKVLQVYRSMDYQLKNGCIQKLMVANYLAPHRGMIYKRGKQYSVPGFTFNVDHAYTIGKWRIVISRGLHAYVSEYAARKTWSVEIYSKTHAAYEMYIPKGAKYYLGKDGEIVSTELIFKPLPR